MQELIKIENKEFNNESIRTVNARELWKALGSKQDFSDWIKKRIKKYEFVENIDFVNVHKKMTIENTNIKRDTIEYFISIDMAKELCMVENNEKGRQIRKYFIQCEKQLKEIKNKDSYLIEDPIERAKAWIAEQEKHLQIENEQKEKITEQKETITNFETLSQKRINKKELFQKINDLIRKKAKENFFGNYAESYKYYYAQLDKIHLFNHPITMDFLKKNTKYAKELLEILLVK